MNEYLSFIENNLSTDFKNYKSVLIAFKTFEEILRDVNFKFEADTDYSKFYNYIYDNLKGSPVFSKLNPHGKELVGLYDVRGGNLTFTIWVYFTCLIAKENPSDLETWRNFGRYMNKYVFDIDSYMKRMIGDKSSSDTFPVGRLLSNFGGIEEGVMQDFLVMLLQSEYFVKCLGQTPDSCSLDEILTMIACNLNTLYYESWKKMGQVFFHLDSIDLDPQLAKSINRYRELLLLSTRDMEENVTAISRHISNALSEISEGADAYNHPSEVIKGFAIGLICEGDEEIKKIFESNIDPTKLELPKTELQMRVMLLSYHTKSKGRTSSSHDNDIPVANFIFVGERESSYLTHSSRGLRIELKKDLLPIAMAGYTLAIQKYNLIKSV